MPEVTRRCPVCPESGGLDRFDSGSVPETALSREGQPAPVAELCSSWTAQASIRVASSRENPIAVKPNARRRLALTRECFRPSAASGCGQRPAKRRTLLRVLDAGEAPVVTQHAQERPRRMRPVRSVNPTRNQPCCRTGGPLSGACLRHSVERRQPVHGQSVARVPVRLHRAPSVTAAAMFKHHFVARFESNVSEIPALATLNRTSKGTLS
jgi:hypothetical protein